MRTIGIRELKARASAVVREVRESGVQYIVTHHGRPVARLIPVADDTIDADATDALWADMDALAADIGAVWPDELSAMDAVREGRREL